MRRLNETETEGHSIKPESMNTSRTVLCCATCYCRPAHILKRFGIEFNLLGGQVKSELRNRGNNFFFLFPVSREESGSEMKELSDLVSSMCRAAIVDRSIWTWPHAPQVRVSSVQPSLVHVSPCRRLHNMHEHGDEIISVYRCSQAGVVIRSSIEFAKRPQLLIELKYGARVYAL